jgi:hypothetical protein
MTKGSNDEYFRLLINYRFWPKILKKSPKLFIIHYSVDLHSKGSTNYKIAFFNRVFSKYFGKIAVF